MDTLSNTLLHFGSECLLVWQQPGNKGQDISLLWHKAAATGRHLYFEFFCYFCSCIYSLWQEAGVVAAVGKVDSGCRQIVATDWFSNSQHDLSFQKGHICNLLQEWQRRMDSIFGCLHWTEVSTWIMFWGMSVRVYAVCFGSSLFGSSLLGAAPCYRSVLQVLLNECSGPAAGCSRW